MKRAAYRVKVTGLVQGVGFRPYLHKLAGRYGVTGHVYNTNCSVELFVEGECSAINNFLTNLREKPPLLARIEELTLEEAEPAGCDTFKITKSSDNSRGVTLVSPDIALCDDCLTDMQRQPRRLDYPFTNCINCGPRFSIIRELPYDRAMTTMEPFAMCDGCRGEYEDINDRRYHAQPNACARCGPAYLLYEGGSEYGELSEILKRTVSLIEAGETVAIKGLGGFQLACDPFNSEAVQALRMRKRREAKPFALMCSSLEAAARLAHISPEERELLTSQARPVVTLKLKGNPFPEVTCGLDRVGVMLPYMPLHYLLFRELNGESLVLTSGNISDSPIEISNEGAMERLGGELQAGGVLVYNREIHNRLDDSVLFVCRGKSRFIRRSRGYVPEPVRLKGLKPDGIIALGGELKSTFAMGKGERLFLSQHIGDLKSWDVELFYRESVERFSRLFRVEPQLAAIDMHPEYRSSLYGKTLGVELTEVQHHHAHIAAVMAEHGLDEPVIGVALDGTGYGDDGNIWGGEFLLCDLARYERLLHFAYLPLPGGDKAAVEPWRIGAALLHSLYGEEARRVAGDIGFLKKERSETVEMLFAMLAGGVNCPLSSGAGRLFDGVAALVGLCSRSRYEAEAPMLLEALLSRGGCEPEKGGAYQFSFGRESLSFAPMIEQIVADLKEGRGVELISARFHNTVIEAVFEGVKRIAGSRGRTKVVLSGGVFLNRYLLEQLELRLEKAGFQPYSPLLFPANDGGLALGQAAVAAKRRILGELF